MPVLHWRDQAKLDERNRGRSKKKSSSSKYQIEDDDGEDDRAENDLDPTIKEDNDAENDENIVPLSQSPLKRERKKPFGGPGVPPSNAGYETNDTVTGPSSAGEDRDLGDLASDEEEQKDHDDDNDDDDDEEGKDQQHVKLDNQLENPAKKTNKTRKKRGERGEGDETNDDDNAEDVGPATRLRSQGPETDADVSEDDEVRSGYGSSVDYEVDYRFEMENDGNEAVDVIKLWQNQRSEELEDKARRQCNSCDRSIAAWRCHGCDYNFCEECNRDVHSQYCMKFRPKDHVLQRLDGRPLSCGRCRKGVWEIAKHGYDHFNHQYQKKRKEMRKQRMTEELDVLKETVSDQKSIFKRERKGHRLRQAQEDKLSEMYRVGKEEAAAKIKTELDLYFGPMTTPLHFDPKQLTLERGDNGQPLIPPPVDETGRAVAMFSFDFNRNCIMCRACNVFWNSGPVFGRRVVVNAYAPVGPVIDPEAAARRTVKRIHDSKIHAKLMEKLRLEALAKAKIKPPKKSRACVVM